MLYNVIPHLLFPREQDDDDKTGSGGKEDHGENDGDKTGSGGKEADGENDGGSGGKEDGEYDRVSGRKEDDGENKNDRGSGGKKLMVTMMGKETDSEKEDDKEKMERTTM